MAHGPDVADTLEAAARELQAAAQGIRGGTVSVATSLGQRMQVIGTAKRVLEAVQQPTDSLVDVMVQLASLVATRLFIKWGVFEKMPRAVGETISYAELAGAVGADEELISTYSPSLYGPLFHFLRHKLKNGPSRLQPGSPGCSCRRGC